MLRAVPLLLEEAPSMHSGQHETKMLLPRTVGSVSQQYNLDEQSFMAY